LAHLTAQRVGVPDLLDQVAQLFGGQAPSGGLLAPTAPESWLQLVVAVMDRLGPGSGRAARTTPLKASSRP
jgi:hypothetical protein